MALMIQQAGGVSDGQVSGGLALAQEVMASVMLRCRSSELMRVQSLECGLWQRAP
jgi:hypothetical protein